MAPTKFVSFKIDNVDKDAYRTEFFDWVRARIGDEAKIELTRNTNALLHCGTALVSVPESAAQNVEALNGSMFFNEKLSVSKTDARRNKKTASEPKRERRATVEGPTNILFLSHPSINVRGEEGITEEMLTEEFKPYRVVRVRVPAQKTKFCFLDFETVEDATAALNAENGKVVNNKPYKVEYSRSVPNSRTKNTEAPTEDESAATTTEAAETTEAPAAEGEKATTWESANWD